MIVDSNNIVDFFSNVMIGSTGGDALFLGIIIFLVFGFALIYGRARASTALMVGMILVFVFGLLSQQFVFLFWLALLGGVFVLVNGLRKWIQGV